MKFCRKCRFWFKPDLWKYCPMCATPLLTEKETEQLMKEEEEVDNRREMGELSK